MSPEQFTYWMQGFVELTNGLPPTEAQWKSICDHLKTVFHKVTPEVAAPVLPARTREFPKAPDDWVQATTIIC